MNVSNGVDIKGTITLQETVPKAALIVRQHRLFKKRGTCAKVWEADLCSASPVELHVKVPMIGSALARDCRMPCTAPQRSITLC